MVARFLEYINTPTIVIEESFPCFAKVSMNMAIVTSKIIVEGSDQSSRDTAGKMHEHHFVMAMNRHLGHESGFMPDDSRKDETIAAMKKLRVNMRPGVEEEIKRKATVSAEHIHKFIHDNGHFHHGTYVSSKDGDIQNITGVKYGQKENASDVVSHIKDEDGRTKFMGISLKHNGNGTGHKPSSNPGLGTTDKDLSVETSHHMIQARRDLDDQYPKFAHLPVGKKKAMAKGKQKDGTPATKYYHAAYKHVKIALNKIADDHADAFNKMPHAAQLSHFRTQVHAHYTADVPQIVVTSHKAGTRIENRAHDYDPSKIKAIAAKKVGHIVRHHVDFHDGHTEVWDHRYKMADGPISSVKGSFERQPDKQ